MEKKDGSKWVGVLGVSLFIFWLVFGVAPYLRHKSQWDGYSFGDKVDWVATNSLFYDSYYIFAVVGGWQCSIVASILCFYLMLTKKIDDTIVHVVCITLFSLATVLLIAVTRNSIGSVVRVLE